MYHVKPPSAIPDQLRALTRWVRWDRVTVRGGRATKRPQGSTRSGPWYSLDDAVSRLPEEALTEQCGVGLVTTGPVDLGDGRTLFALDIDGCRHPQTGEIAAWAQDVVRTFNSYTEVTPSGSGLRVFGYVDGQVPALSVVHVPAPVLGGDHQRCEIQVFGSGPAGYVTVTGDRLPGAPAEIRSGVEGFDWLRRTYPDTTSAAEVVYDAKPIGRPPTVDELDDAVLRRSTAAEIALVEHGDWQSMRLPSASEGWYILEQLVLAHCADHVDVAVQWLLERTAYGRGDVEDSKDPVRYGNERWVKADLYRVAGKRRAAVLSMFSEVPTNGLGALGDHQRGPFDDLAPPRGAAPAASNGVAAPTAAREGFFESIGALMARDPRPSWLVDGLIERDALVALSGAPASFKSFLIFDILLALATGRDWHGRATMASPALIVAGEGRGGLSRRFHAWAVENEVDLSKALIGVSRFAASILDDEGFAFLVAEAKQYVRSWGRCPGLIVVDTLNRNFGPGDENSTADMTKFWQRCDQLKRVFPGTTVVVVHHVGHGNTNRSRGSSVIGGTVDAEIVLTREYDKKTEKPKPGARVTFRKMKDAEEPDPFWICTKFVTLGETSTGEPYGSLVIDRVSAEEPTASGDPLTDPEVQADIDAVLRVYQDAPAASLKEAQAAFGPGVRKFKIARRIVLDYGLLEKTGTTSDVQHVVTAVGVERLTGASVEIATVAEPDAEDALARLAAELLG